jgi:hypothetical protein
MYDIDLILAPYAALGFTIVALPVFWLLWKIKPFRWIVLKICGTRRVKRILNWFAEILEELGKPIE